MWTPEPEPSDHCASFILKSDAELPTVRALWSTGLQTSTSFNIKRSHTDPFLLTRPVAAAHLLVLTTAASQVGPPVLHAAAKLVLEPWRPHQTNGSKPSFVFGVGASSSPAAHFFFKLRV